MYVVNLKYFCIICRFQLLSTILSASEKEIIITHGTDTLIETGIWLETQLNPISNGTVGKNPKKVQFREAALVASKKISTFFEIIFPFGMSPKEHARNEDFFFEKTLILAFEVIKANLTKEGRLHDFTTLSVWPD